MPKIKWRHKKEIGYDSTKDYEASEPMSPAKIKEHEPTAVRREMTEKITEGDKRATNPEAKEIARKSGWLGDSRH